MSKFIKKWDHSEPGSTLGRILSKIHRQPQLKERLLNTLYRLQVIESRLEELSRKMEQKDRILFSRCSEAVADRDEARAKIYANECMEIRKLLKIFLRSQLAIEQVALKLETVREFGDVIVAIRPVSNVVAALKKQLVGVMPEVSREMGFVTDTLNQLVVEIGEGSKTSSALETANDEAQTILKEASVIADNKMKEQLPDLPLVLTSNSRPYSKF